MTQQLPLQGGHLDHLMLPSQKAHSVLLDLVNQCWQNGHFWYLLVQGLDLLLREQQLVLQAGHLHNLLLVVHPAHHLGRRLFSSRRLQLSLQALNLSLQ